MLNIFNVIENDHEQILENVISMFIRMMKGIKY